MKVTVELMGRSYHVADQLPRELDLPAGASLDDAVERINQHLPDDQPLPQSCLIIVSGKHLGSLVHHDDTMLTDGAELVFVAPVAGG